MNLHVLLALESFFYAIYGEFKTFYNMSHIGCTIDYIPMIEKGIIEFFASFFLWIMFAGIFVLWIYDGKIKKEQALHALVAGTLAWILAWIIKSIFPTERPFQLNGNETFVFTPLTNGAFPSGHTAAAFSIAWTIWKHDKKVGVIYLLSAFAVGISRVLANVHYPIDVVAGGILGVITSNIIQKVHFKKLFKK